MEKLYQPRPSVGTTFTLAILSFLAGVLFTIAVLAIFNR